MDLKRRKTGRRCLSLGLLASFVRSALVIWSPLALYELASFSYSTSRSLRKTQGTEFTSRWSYACEMKVAVLRITHIPCETHSPTTSA